MDKFSIFLVRHKIEFYKLIKQKIHFHPGWFKKRKQKLEKRGQKRVAARCSTQKMCKIFNLDKADSDGTLILIFGSFPLCQQREMMKRIVVFFWRPVCDNIFKNVWVPCILQRAAASGYKLVYDFCCSS